jgi:endothelin-converting enzyme/putative endopeptidase
MTELFENVRSALRTRIENLTWMTPETKVRALEKLDKMTAKIAYPDKWRDFSGLHIRANDLIGNVKRVREFDAARDVARLGQPVDKAEWFTGPQTVNAFYSPSRNEAFIPAGYIQSPLFDPNADPALNYGAIGSIVGHEIGHGFDDQGSKYDGDGFLADWWSEEDRAAFDALGDRLAEQFSKYEALPGLFVNGRQTLGENIGDLAGVVVAYHAYLLSLDGDEPPVLDGFTGPQRVFLGRAQARRFKQTEESMRQRLLSAPHSPMDLRVNGMVVNIDEWYEAFDVEPGDAMYLPPEDRVYIW